MLALNLLFLFSFSFFLSFFPSFFLVSQIYADHFYSSSLYNRNEFLLHLEKCDKKREKCKVDGCHFWGNKGEKAKHNVEHAHQHVKLLIRSEEKLKEFLIEKVELKPKESYM